MSRGTRRSVFVRKVFVRTGVVIALVAVGLIAAWCSDAWVIRNDGPITSDDVVVPPDPPPAPRVRAATPVVQPEPPATPTAIPNDPPPPPAPAQSLVRVRVLDATGAPAADAMVSVVDRRVSHNEGGGELTSGRTDAEGTAELRIDGDQSIAVVARKGAWAAVRGNYAARTKAPLDVELRLVEAPPIRGVVRYRDGVPVAGAPVIGWFQTAPLSHWQHSVVTVTDHDGRFALHGVPLDHRAREAPVKVPHEMGVRWGTSTTISPGAFDELVVLEMPRLCRLRARFVDADGDAVEPARLTWVSSSNSYDTATDRDGRVEIFVPYATYSVDLRSMDTVGWSRSDIDLARAELDLGTITLEEGVAVRGVVQNPDGTPAERAQVSVDGAWWNVGTDAEGRFEILHLHPGARTLTARSSDGWAWEEDYHTVHQVAAPSEGLVVRLESGRFLSISFVTTSGEPIAVRKVQLTVRDVDGSRVFGATFEGLGEAVRRRISRAGTFDVEVTVDDDEPVLFAGVTIDDTGETTLSVPVTLLE